MSGPRAVPYLLRLLQLPQDQLDAADVKADFGRGVLDGREGLQGSPPLPPVRGTHPLLPQPDGLHQGHGAAGSPSRGSRPSLSLSLSLLVAQLGLSFSPSLCLSPAPVTECRKWPHRITGPGWGSGAGADAAGSRGWALLLSGSRCPPARLLIFPFIREKPCILSAGWFIGSNFRLQKGRMGAGLSPWCPAKSSLIIAQRLLQAQLGAEGEPKAPPGKPLVLPAPTVLSQCGVSRLRAHGAARG